MQAGTCLVICSNRQDNENFVNLEFEWDCCTTAKMFISPLLFDNSLRPGRIRVLYIHIFILTLAQRLLIGLDKPSKVGYSLLQSFVL
jgi:hypothetical protein